MSVREGEGISPLEYYIGEDWDGEETCGECGHLLRPDPEFTIPEDDYDECLGYGNEQILTPVEDWVPEMRCENPECEKHWEGR
jgi:hypothetical protein